MVARGRGTDGEVGKAGVRRVQRELYGSASIGASNYDQCDKDRCMSEEHCESSAKEMRDRGASIGPGDCGRMRTVAAMPVLMAGGAERPRGTQGHHCGCNEPQDAALRGVARVSQCVDRDACHCHRETE